jgi:23S rRNA (adenine2503-C2)-methyltransferase
VTDGDEADEIYLSDLWVEISHVRYIVTLNGIAYDVTDLRYADTPIVSTAVGVTSFSVEARIYSPRALVNWCRIEPLYNYDNVKQALLIASDEAGISLSKRRITLSTSGVVPFIEPTGREIGTMLAISLHAVRDELRDMLVPINKKYPLAELIKACRDYPGLSNARRITFEYVMLKDINDSDADARELVRLLAGIPAKINLIPFNPWPGTRYTCSDWDRIERFSDIVFRAGYASPVRTPRGRDILAACGQLKSETEKLGARARMLLDEADAATAGRAALSPATPAA